MSRLADTVFCPPLVRNLKGTIHLPECRYADSGRPWAWAEDRSLGEVHDASQRNGLKACKTCDPFFLEHGLLARAADESEEA